MHKKFAKAFVFILLAAGIAALGGAAVYVFGPAKKTDVLYSIGSLGGNSYACDTNLGTTLFPVIELGDEVLDPVKLEAEAFEGGSSIALEVNDDTVSFLTATSVEVGLLEPMVMSILRNDDDVLAAVKYFPSAGIQGSAEINTLIVNKKTGYAVWSKMRDQALFSDHPDAQVYYLSCI